MHSFARIYTTKGCTGAGCTCVRKELLNVKAEKLYKPLKGVKEDYILKSIQKLLKNMVIPLHRDSYP